MAMMAPIPGQSLTDEPQNFAWERPPEYVDPDEALIFHMDRLSEKEVAESVLFLMEYGYPVDVLTRSLLTASVGEGMHSVDVSLIISPAIEEELSYMARTAGIDYKDTFSEDQTKEEAEEERLRALLLKKLDDKLGKGDDSVSRSAVEAMGSPAEDDLEAMQESMAQENMEDESVVSEEPMEEEMPEVPQRTGGLMSRGV
jgi:hypothetical protein